jgi:omega-amidase
MTIQSEINVAAVQTNIKWLDAAANYACLEALLFDIDADLIVLPETYSSGFAFSEDRCGEPEFGPSFLWMQQLAKIKSAAIVGSIAIQLKNTKVNRCYFVFPDGSFEFYDKRHLFRMAGEDQLVTAGSERKVVSYLGWNILLQVCYDLRFPVWSRSQNDYDILINVANWPAARRNPWDILLQARAIENLAYVIGVNRVGSDGNSIKHSGGTVLLDFKGEPLKRAKDNHTEIIHHCLNFDQLKRFRHQFPAHLDSDQFIIKT